VSVDRGWDRRAFLSGALRTFAGAAVAGRPFPFLGDLLAANADSGSTPNATDTGAQAVTGDAAASRVLAAALGAIVPAAGPGPSAEQARLATHLAAVTAAPEFASLRHQWHVAAPLLDTLAHTQTGRGFCELDPATAAEVLRACASGKAGDWMSADAPQTLVRSLLEFALEGYFGHHRHGGNPDGIVWRAYGLDAMLATVDGHAGHAEATSSPPPADADEAGLYGKNWDVIVIGSGAGGAALAWRLATRGVNVLVLEKGPRITPGVADHDEIAATRRNRFVPYVKDEPHVVVAPGAAPERRSDGWTACCVGGGTVHMSAMLLRMHPRDFEGHAGQAPWPFGYRTLAPYYDLVERYLGISGHRAANPFEDAAPPLPLPPIAAHPASHAVVSVLRAAGLHPYPTPRGILARPYTGRSGCVYCPFCGGYACEVGAKAGADVTYLHDAVATGRARVVSGVRVEGIRVTRERAFGVEIQTAPLTPRTIGGKVIVLAAGAVESARLALLSVSLAALDGLGNQHGQVGRNLTGSYNAGIAASFAFPGKLFPTAADGQPFVNVAVQDLYAAGCGTIVCDRRPLSPIQHALQVAAAEPLPLLGVSLKERLFLELARSRSLVVESFIPMRPHPERRVSLDDHVKDAWNIPAARITLARHADDVRLGRRVVAVGDALFRAAGAERHTHAVELEETPFLMSGSMRMGQQPSTSVTDGNGKVHGLSNVYVADGGALPGMGGVPPTLTIMANAIRIADAIVSSRGST